MELPGGGHAAAWSYSGLLHGFGGGGPGQGWVTALVILTINTPTQKAWTRHGDWACGWSQWRLEWPQVTPCSLQGACLVYINAVIVSRVALEAMASQASLGT
jgi:hypothetical protein